MNIKRCENCNKILARKENERIQSFERRRFCNYSCRSKVTMLGNRNGLNSKSKLEQKLGRYLTKDELIHHVNCIRDDDAPENLMVIESRNAHMRLHQLERRGLAVGN